MSDWTVVFSKDAQKDSKLTQRAGLKLKVENLLSIIIKKPFENPPSYEKLSGDLKGFYSRRINIQHRLIYEVHKETRTVKILSMWDHYE